VPAARDDEALKRPEMKPADPEMESA